MWNAFVFFSWLWYTRVHSVADFGLWGRGADARGRLRGLEGDLSEF